MTLQGLTVRQLQVYSCSHSPSMSISRSLVQFSQSLTLIVLHLVDTRLLVALYNIENTEQHNTVYVYGGTRKYDNLNGPDHGRIMHSAQERSDCQQPFDTVIVQLDKLIHL